jgi:guanylate kinase
VAAAVVAAVERLWLSRSWTTRPRRPGETEAHYHFVDPATFEAAEGAGAFLESATFLGHCYGTPRPDPPEGHDVLLEIDMQGARQVLERRPDATVVLLLPPSEAVQRARLESRGDDPEHVRQRLERGHAEVAEARALDALEVVNDRLEQAVAEVAGIVAGERAARGRGGAHALRAREAEPGAR